MAKKQSWKRVKAPQPWRPVSGDELVGTYIGSKNKSGKFGDYLIHFVKVKGNIIHYVSGTAVDDLFALLEPETLVKIVYTGKKIAKSSGNEYKTYELYTEDAIEFKIFDEAA